jgi:heavy metal sensor kinase
MWLRHLIDHRHDLSVRLALWYTGILMVTLTGTLIILYLSMGTYLRHHVDMAMLNELDEFNTLFKEGGLSAVAREMQLESESEGVGRLFFRLLAGDGQTLLHSDLTAWSGVAVDPALIRRADEVDNHFETIKMPGQDFEARVLIGRIGTDHFLQIVHSLREDAIFLNNIATLLLWFAAALILVGIASGWYVSRMAVAGIRDITRAAEKISAGRFEIRAETKNRLGEIEKLATTFNLMLDRIGSLMNNLREVNDNIAHDLRSPIGRIRSAAELALTGKEHPTEQRKALARTLTECDRLLGMINTMLLISEIESGLRPTGNEHVDLGQMIEEACDLFGPVADVKRVSLKLNKPQRVITVHGNAAALQRMVANLLDNAIKYTHPGGNVWIQVTLAKKSVEIRFHDTGVGIAPRDIPHLFERFYRCDPSRRRSGSGLGLSLVQAVAKSHGGTIEVKSVSGEGSQFIVRLPIRV